MSGYAYLWEFHVAPHSQQDFERHYGTDGSWAMLFRQHPGYISTSLFQDRANPLRYVTIDRWQNIEAYENFRARYASQYDELDQMCQNLTTRETSLGNLR